MLSDPVTKFRLRGVGDCREDLPFRSDHGLPEKLEAPVLREAFELLDESQRFLHPFGPKVDD